MLWPVRVVGRWLPRGWAHFGLQLLVFGVFDLAYEISRGLATGRRPVALRHGEDIVSAERRLGIFWELDVQRWARSAPGIVMDVANWTYFNCQFTITFAFFVWVYARRNKTWPLLRNTFLTTLLLGVIGYLTYPAAPPRLLPTDYGFVDTLAATALSQQSEAVARLANPYAAMPSLHTATALLVGATGVLICGSLAAKVVWALYPGLVVFSIVATANHYLLDAVAGAGVLLLALSLNVGWDWWRRRKQLLV